MNLDPPDHRHLQMRRVKGDELAFLFTLRYLSHEWGGSEKTCKLAFLFGQLTPGAGDEGKHSTLSDLG